MIDGEVMMGVTGPWSGQKKQLNINNCDPMGNVNYLNRCELILNKKNVWY